jgi:hypothetical protein
MNLAKRKLAIAFSLTAPSTLLDAKSAISSEGNCAGFWGNDAIDQKLHDISGSGPVVLDSGFSRLKAYAPMNITVSYAGHEWHAQTIPDVINWIKVGNNWKVASEIILPVPPTSGIKG